MQNVKGSTKLLVAAFSLLASTITGCSVFGIHSYESPPYETVLKEDDKEIRYYGPYIVAKTTVTGEYEEAQGSAFRILANYIFGDNIKKQKIAMTGAVVQAPSNTSQKLPMTAPVVQSPTEGGWTMTFMMPSKYTIEDLPTPTDKRISFETIPAKYAAAIRFTWLEGERRNKKKAIKLQNWLADQKAYTPISLPMYAGYDPPWTLPFFRRNEMMIEIKKNRIDNTDGQKNQSK